MKLRGKKSLCIIGVIIVPTMMFTACGGGKSEADKKAADTSKSAQAKPTLAPKREVKGEIFITQKNEQSVKMSSVTVSIYPAAAATEHVARLKENFLKFAQETLAKVRLHESLIVSNGTEISRLKSVVYQYSDTRDAQLLILQRLSTDRQYLAGNPYKLKEWQAARTQLEQSSNAVVAAVMKMEEIVAESKAMQSEDSVPSFVNFARESSWPRPVAETVSSADGQFSFSLPSGTNYTAIAFSSRLLSTKRELYFWKADIPDDNRLEMGSNALEKIEETPR